MYYSCKWGYGKAARTLAGVTAAALPAAATADVHVYYGPPIPLEPDGFSGEVTLSLDGLDEDEFGIELAPSSPTALPPRAPQARGLLDGKARSDDPSPPHSTGL